MCLSAGLMKALENPFMIPLCVKSALLVFSYLKMFIMSNRVSLFQQGKFRKIKSLTKQEHLLFYLLLRLLAKSKIFFIFANNIKLRNFEAFWKICIHNTFEVVQYFVERYVFTALSSFLIATLVYFLGQCVIMWLSS